ncbi:MAG: ferritin-like domain-containing protein [Candidatus Micrarchaeia archaeon]
MGKTAKELVGEKAEEVIAELNKALADEWLAYVQYLMAASIVKHPNAAKELEDVAKEELEHAEEVTERILQLGGKPVVDQKQLYEITNCGYEAPSEETIESLKGALKGENCAIKIYHKIAMMTKDCDVVTYNLALHIMEEEIDHEERFEALVEWIEG